MKKALAVILILIELAVAQWVPAGSVAELDDAGAVLVNPAGLGRSRNFNSRLLLPIAYRHDEDQSRGFTLTLQTGTTGMGYSNLPGRRDRFYIGGGQELGAGLHIGLMSHFSGRGYEALDLGFLWRCSEWLSLGSSYANLYSRGEADQPFSAAVAVRPLGDRLTVSLEQRQIILDNGGSKQSAAVLGIAAGLLPGLAIRSDYDFNARGVNIGLTFTTGNAGIESYSGFTSSGKLAAGGLIGLNTNLDRKPALPKKSKQQYVEIRFQDGLDDSPSANVIFGRKNVTLRQAIGLLDRIGADPAVAGIVIYPQELIIGSGMLSELHAALVRFKAQGKRIYVFADFLIDSQYALVALADGIYMNHGGALLLDGIAMGMEFWKGTFDKLGLEAQYYRRGQYKNAAETYTRERMSEPSRVALEAVLTDTDHEYRRMLQDRRDLTDERLTEVFGQALFAADQALAAGLVDGLYHPDQVASIISQAIGTEIALVKARRWQWCWEETWQAGLAPQIALIYAEGMILPGRSVPSTFGRSRQIGAVTTSAAIREAREDPLVKAIVLRINSPGGAVVASEDIWREVYRTTHPDSSDEKHRKPLYVSMGNVAASGGYLIACAADTIVATPGCITGSIGVVTGKISLGGLFTKIGFNLDVLRTAPHADMFSLHRPFTTEEGDRVQTLVDSYYEQFLEHVATGRGLTRAQVDSIGQGRVWSGTAARELGLVDELGGLRETLALVKQRLGVDPERNITLKIYPGSEQAGLLISLDSESSLLERLEELDRHLDIGLILDRIALLNREPAVYLMEELIAIE
ncbi:MAG: signal peptide peptidase SppA [Candidatus Neomarinimicrobiota bacterium]